ncbi:MAG: D-alanyl-D-alanine carboxypeptidase [Oscillospiraceae bacterium]|nr:D-alanyl-D-alanine carboxypeptidase [Oscillospiraceae bacterium]
MIKRSVGFFITVAVLTMSVFADGGELAGCRAKGAAVAELSSGRIIASHNADERLPVASTTKIMTALLTIEHGDLDTPFVVDSEAIKVEGTSMGLKEGDTVTLRTLAWGMLLASGNDAANAAAVRIDGSTKKFAERMNERAAEIGMTNTLFTTPSGLDTDSPYSSAGDMARLACEAMKNPVFAEMAGTKSAKLFYGNPPYDRWLTNHNRLLKTDERAVGVKTGFTKAAGRCLVSAAQKDGLTLIAVTLNCPDDFNYHSGLYDEFFDKLEYVDFTHMAQNLMASVTGADENKLPLDAAEKLGAYLMPGEKDKVGINFLVEPFLYAPVEKGEKVGEAVLTLSGERIAAASLVGAETRVAFYQNKSIVERVEQFFGFPELRFFRFPLPNSN